MSIDEPKITVIPPSDEYPPRNTGTYRIRPLPEPVAVPAEVIDTPEARYYVFIQEQFARQDEITREERFALAAYRAYTDDKFDQQNIELAQQRDLLAQTVGTLHDVGAAVAALKDLPSIVDRLRGEVVQMRKCIRRVEGEIKFANNQIRSTQSSQAELEGRLMALEARHGELWDAIHAIEEELDMREVADEEDDDGGETPTPDAAGPPSSPPSDSSD